MTSTTDRNDRIKDASRRLERAVSDLAAAAGESAATHVERVAGRLKRQNRERREHDANGAQREPAWLWSARPRSPKFYRDAERGKVFGVCAGLANHLGVETWVVRCAALVGLFMLNWVFFVAYIVAACVLDKDPGVDEWPEEDDFEPAEASETPARRRQSSKRDVAEQSTRQALRDVRADFDANEQRLQRMEAHITSGQYELQRELARIDPSAR